jgi:hypothetical protein
VPTPLKLDDEPETLAARIADAHGDSPAWLDRFAAALDRRRSGSELERVLSVWGLTKADAARMFGISRQAVSKWTASGVPLDRLEAIADLAAATDLLVRHLKRDRIPAVVRRPVEAAGGVALVDLAAASPGLALEHTRAMFDFSRIHA